MNPEPVVLINAFEVPAGQDEEFLAAWHSPQEFQAATAQPGFTSAPVPFPFHASLYQVVREDQR